MIYNEKVIKPINHYSQIKLNNPFNSLLQKNYFFYHFKKFRNNNCTTDAQYLRYNFNEKSII